MRSVEVIGTIAATTWKANLRSKERAMFPSFVEQEFWDLISEPLSGAQRYAPKKAGRLVLYTWFQRAERCESRQSAEALPLIGQLSVVLSEFALLGTQSDGSFGEPETQGTEFQSAFECSTN